MAKIQNIAIGNLSLWDQNARFLNKYFGRTEQERIEYFLSQTSFKISELIDAVVEDFDLIQSERLIVCEQDGKNIVLEGNRRLVVYKLLSNPDLTSDSTLKSKLDELKASIKIDDNFELECIVVEDESEGLRYIDRKHLKRNNEVSWGDNERAHHQVRRGKATTKERFKVAITKRIRDSDCPEHMQDRILGPGFVTTFWRIIQSKSAKTTFGLSLDEDNNLQTTDEDFDEKLKFIIVDVLAKDKLKDKDKVFSRLKVKEIETYFMTISNDDYERVDKKIKEQSETDLFSTELNPTTPPIDEDPPTKPKSLNRKYLIPKDCKLLIEETKIHNIYCELKDDLLIDDSKEAVPNAVGVLFRVFLEVSLDYYAEKNGNKFQKKETIKQKIPWVIKDLEKEYDKKEFKEIRKVGSASGDKSYLSIENFHEYVHSTTIQPTPGELKAKWDNLQPFFKILWD